jgi:hypothetical protein
MTEKELSLGKLPLSVVFARLFSGYSRLCSFPVFGLVEVCNLYCCIAVEAGGGVGLVVVGTLRGIALGTVLEPQANVPRTRPELRSRRSQNKQPDFTQS